MQVSLAFYNVIRNLDMIKIVLAVIIGSSIDSVFNNVDYKLPVGHTEKVAKIAQKF